jgi:tRNA threonylcarbamoyl adenosine modification protein YeaZ
VIVGFSTSSPLSSVCIGDPEVGLIWEGEEIALGRASETCLGLLQTGLAEKGIELEEIGLFIADVGPGSFTGVRVGLMLAKTLAWNLRAPCGGVEAFDLISPDGPVAIPSRKGEYFLRFPDSEPFRATTLPPETKGYGFEGRVDYPRASVALRLLARIKAGSPIDLMPKYLAEPSISTPKRPLSRIPT